MMMHNRVRTSNKCFLSWVFSDGTNKIVFHDAPHWWYMILATYHVRCWNGRSKPYRLRSVLLTTLFITKIPCYQDNATFLIAKKISHSFIAKKTQHSSLQRKHDVLSLQRKHNIPHCKENWHSFTAKKTRHSLLQRKHAFLTTRK